MALYENEKDKTKAYIHPETEYNPVFGCQKKLGLDNCSGFTNTFHYGEEEQKKTVAKLIEKGVSLSLLIEINKKFPLFINFILLNQEFVDCLRVKSVNQWFRLEWVRKENRNKYLQFFIKRETNGIFTKLICKDFTYGDEKVRRLVREPNPSDFVNSFNWFLNKCT